MKCQSVAVPLIFSGTYGYPKAQVLKVALEVIKEFLYQIFIKKAGAMIYFVMFFIVFAALPFVKYIFSFAKKLLVAKQIVTFFIKSLLI